MIRGELATLLIVAIALCSCTQVFPGRISLQRRDPSTPEERTRAVQMAKSLQGDPLAPDLQGDRDWLIKWQLEVPDISVKSVKFCASFLGDLGDPKSGYPGAVNFTMLASELAFVIEHPDKANDVEAIYLAGVDGALHGYEAIHKKDMSYRLPHLDDLVQKRDQGKLADYVYATAKECK